MEEPGHPFSEDFRSRLSLVLANKASGSKLEMESGDTPNLKSENVYLETEIDSYAGKGLASSNQRPATPPKPTLRSVTSVKANVDDAKLNKNPFLSVLSKGDTPPYASVNKQKFRPNVPLKPKPEKLGRLSVFHSTTSLTDQPALQNSDRSSGIGTNFPRNGSLPDISPLKISSGSGGRVHTELVCASSAREYGQLNQVPRHSKDVVGDHENIHYCDVIPESPPYVNDYVNEKNNSKNKGNQSENIYEDVKIKFELQTPKLTSLDHVTDYTPMSSPVCGSNFIFDKKRPLYENTSGLSSDFDLGSYEKVGFSSLDQQTPASKKSDERAERTVNGDADDELENLNCDINTTADDSRRVSLVSPSSSFTGPLSIASTTASSFVGIQVCYFPPEPPPEFRNDNLTGLPAEEIQQDTSPQSSAASTVSRRRSRIPVPVKSATLDRRYANVPAEQEAANLTPPPSPVIKPKSKKGKASSEITLSSPTPPLTKTAKWYEKLGCIATDATTPSEPYGRPGERKRSKSLNREKSKSQFYLSNETTGLEPI